MKTIETKVQLTEGAEVSWLCTQRGGYCLQFRVPARIVKIGAKRVQIAAKLENGGEKLVWVKAENLRWPK